MRTVNWHRVLMALAITLGITLAASSGLLLLRPYLPESWSEPVLWTAMAIMGAGFVPLLLMQVVKVLGLIFWHPDRGPY